MGQQLAMLIGGIDLSIGPLMGFLVVLGSFVLQEGFVSWQLDVGLLLLVLAALAIGAINWLLAVPLRVPAMIATLVTFTALQGISLLLRPLPGGQISRDLIDQISFAVGPVPVMAILAIILAIVLDLVLGRTILGVRLRAVGSATAVARRVGVNTSRVMLVAFAGASALTVLSALMLIAQIQVGDPTSGTDYTLLTITAVVLGGASIFGGRGSMVNALLGAFLLTEVNTVAGFLNLNSSWQQFLLGGLTLIAVGAYSSLRYPSALLQSVRRLRRPRDARLEGVGA
jgi:ribose/xylose/arabinose/galactoside ABC-type transport system permease subunit